MADPLQGKGCDLQSLGRLGAFLSSIYSQPLLYPSLYLHLGVGRERKEHSSVEGQNPSPPDRTGTSPFSTTVPKGRFARFEFRRKTLSLFLRNSNLATSQIKGNLDMAGLILYPICIFSQKKGLTRNILIRKNRPPTRFFSKASLCPELIFVHKCFAFGNSWPHLL